MTYSRSHPKTSLKWNKNGDLDSGDMLFDFREAQK